MDKRRVTIFLLNAAGSFAAVGLMLGGWLFSLRNLCALYAEDGTLLGWCLLLSLASAILACLPSKFRWGAAGCLIAGAILALWRWEPLLPALREILARAAVPLSDLFPALSLPQTDSTVILPLSCLVFLAAVMALLLGLFAAIQCWWAAMAFCFLPFLPGIMGGILPSWPGFLAMAAGGLTLLFTALYRPEEPRSMGWSRLLSLAMSLLFLLTLTVALPQDTYEYPQWAMDGREWLLNAFSHGIDSANGWQLPTGLPTGGDEGETSSYTIYQGEQVDLSAAGPRHFTGQTVLRVEGTESGRVYLRGSSSSLYTGTSWEPISEETYQDLLQDLSLYTPQEAQLQALLYPAAYLSGAEEAASLTVSHIALTGSIAYTPYQPAGDTTGMLSLIRDTCFIRSPDQSSYQLSYYPDFLPSSAAMTFGQEALYWDFVYHNYLEVPEETAQILEPLSARLPEMTVQTPEGLADDYRYAVTTALQIAQLLGETAEYDLDTPAMEEGEDFVAHFLEEGRGYCVHFATTAALLLRMQGIPARYVSGYTAAITPGETTDVPDSAAHAWVEIYLDGYGWYPVEVTPGGGETGQTAADPTAPDETLPPDESAPDDQPQSETPVVPVQPWESSPVPDESTDAGSSEPTAEPLDLHWLIVPIMVLLLAGLVWSLERLAIWLRRKEEQRPDTNPSALAAYRRCRRLMAVGAAEDPVLEEMARKAKFSQHTLSEEERQLCWQRLHQMAKEAADRLPWWKGLIIRLLERY